MENYFNQRDDKNYAKLTEVVEQLPYFIDQFFLHIQLRTSILTRLNYAYDIRIFFFYLTQKRFKTKEIKDITLDDIESLTAYDIEKYLEYLSNYTFNDKQYHCSIAAKERKLSSLRSLFKFLYKKDMIKSNITTKVDMPKLHQKPILFLEVDEISKLLDETEDGEGLTKRQKSYHKRTKIRDIALISLFLGTGIRISECVGLNMNDVDFNNNAITITRKGGNKSILYFSDEVAKVLLNYKTYIEDNILQQTEFGKKIHTDALFISLQGTRMTVRSIENLVKKYSSIISPLKKITPHKLRSTFGTTLYRETKDIYVVADVLGHSDINTTKKHYAAISDEIKRNAAKKVTLRDKD